MRLILSLALLLLLFTPSPTFAQTPRAKVAASASWQKFYAEFRAAANRRDRVALRRMMSDDFFDGGGGGTADDWIAMVDRNKMWRAFQKSLAQGTVPLKDGRKLSRITKDQSFIFEFGSDKRWRFTAIMGD